MRIFVSIVLLCVCFVSAQAKEIQLLVVDNYPPFSYVEDGEAKGILIDLARAVDEAMPNYSIALKPTKYAQMRKRLEAKDGIGYLGSYFAVNEWPEVYPYSYPLLNEEMVVVCHGVFHKHQAKKWPEDFIGINLALIRSYKGWLKYGTKAKELGILNTLEFPNPDIAIKALVKGIVDCGIFEKTTYMALLSKHEQEAIILPSDLPSVAATISTISVHIGYSQLAFEGDKANAAFAKAFDAQLFKLLTSNKLDEIYTQYGLNGS